MRVVLCRYRESYPVSHLCLAVGIPSRIVDANLIGATDPHQVGHRSDTKEKLQPNPASSNPNWDR